MLLRVDEMTQSCDYCALPFSGKGYSPSDDARFCCYGCYLVQQIVGKQGEDGISAWILIRLGVGAFLSMNVMMISLVLYSNSAAELGGAALRGMRWGSLILSTPAMVILGIPFIAGALRDLRRGRLSMDALIATGSVAAFAVSAAHVIRGSGQVYFDTATMLLLIVTLGRLLEASAKSRTSRAIHDLFDLSPKTARVLREGNEVEIAADEVARGDVMVIKPGERIPADGVIVSGACAVEEAAFTGESGPRSCSVRDKVYGGSLDCDGLISVEATSVGADSLLAQIAKMVSEAQNNRAPVERLAERTASVFVPIVWLIAAGAAAYWGLARHDLERAGLCSLAVLVVACPCALGIATSLATCITIGRAARAGVLIRSGEVLERLPAVRKVFFDKTGTLTLGRPSVESVETTFDGLTADEALSLAATLESGSEHAIARAIVNEARSRGLETGSVTDLKVFPGLGVEGTITIDGAVNRIVVGSAKFFRDGGYQTPNGTDALTTAYVAWDGQIRARISLADAVRPDARSVVDKLAAAGIDCSVLSGDRRGAAEVVAEALGIAEVMSDLLPGEKVDEMRKAKASGRAVAMIGDGINDAPALAEADVGIAVGGGTDLAKESSDVTLLGDDLSRIPWLFAMSRRTHRVIRQNLWWAFGYNMIAIGLAFFGYVHPLIAAVTMVVSSVTVIGNSMRLMRE